MSVAAPRIRVGIGLGVGRLTDRRADLVEIIDALEHLGFDSLWTSDVLGSHAPDALIALAFAAGRTERLKFGTSVLPVPGWTPARLAKQMATLDLLSSGRFFPVLGLGSADADALAAHGVDRADRGPMTEEMIPLLRSIWARDVVDHTGAYYRLSGYRPHIHPVRRGLPVWLGGRSDAELRRAGRLGDGWLASFATPEEVARSIPVVRSAAQAAGREIPDDHFGVLLMYARDGGSDEARAFIRWRRPDRAQADVWAESEDQLNDLLRRHIAAGATKFVLVPAARPATSWRTELAALMSNVDGVRPERIRGAS